MEHEDDSYESKLMSKKMLAEQLSVSVQEVNRRLRIGTLKPWRRKGKVPYFHPDQLDEQLSLSRRRVARRGPDGTVTWSAPSTPTRRVDYSGEDASLVFRELSQGKTLLNIVQEHKIHPLIAEEASKAFVRLQGGLYLSETDLKALEKLPLEGEFPIASGSQLLSMLELMLADFMCEECNKRKRKVCLACAKHINKPKRDNPDVDDDL